MRDDTSADQLARSYTTAPRNFSVPDGNAGSLHLSAELKTRINSVVDEVLGAKATEHSIAAPSLGQLRQQAKRIYLLRRRRERFLPCALLGEPGWDMLLELFSAGTPLSIKRVCVAANVPYSTAWRWIAVLEQNGMVGKVLCGTDRAKTLLTLSSPGEQLMSQFVAEFSQSGNGM